MFYEENINIFLQKFDFDRSMKLISLPCNDNSVFFVVIISYYMKIINSKDFLKIILSFLILRLLKIVMRRPRPYFNKNIKNKTNNYKYDYESCPSGHVFGSYIIIYYISEFIENKNLKNLLYIYPLLMCISRMYLGVHYLSDTVFGYIFGYISCKIFKLNI